jgi:hypothetical protein
MNQGKEVEATTAETAPDTGYWEFVGAENGFEHVTLRWKHSSGLACEEIAPVDMHRHTSDRLRDIITGFVGCVPPMFDMLDLIGSRTKFLDPVKSIRRRNDLFE